MVSLVSRQGRQLQRYDKFGRRLVVGCIPYKLKKVDGYYKLEVLVISSQKREDIMFPKGGWELDESRTQAASREALEEAGVRGNIEDPLGEWSYKSKSRDIIHEAIMYPLKVTKELDHWPEKASRTRKWVNVGQVKRDCKQQWMKDALEILVDRLFPSNLKIHSDVDDITRGSASACLSLDNNYLMAHLWKWRVSQPCLQWLPA